MCESSGRHCRSTQRVSRIFHNQLIFIHLISHKYPFLLLTAGKDKLVDNKAAVQFYSKCGTPAAKKQIKQFTWAFHELHKEEAIRADYYEVIYKHVAKMLQAKDTAGNWPGFKATDLKVGRTSKQYNRPWKLIGLAGAFIAYLLFGLLVWIGTKLFSSRPAAYRFAHVVLRWPKAIFKLFSVLRSSGVTMTPLPPGISAASRVALEARRASLY